ncbi:MAG: GGDEF domain-containing protein [bacterium]
MTLDEPANASVRLARTEAAIVLLQSGVAFVFVIGAYTGLFDIPSPTREICVGWVWTYHVLVAVYSFAFRVKGRTIAAIEPMIPLLDVSCATAVYIALGDPVSPVWSIYLYALIGYSRRYQGLGYLGVASYTILNLLVGWLAIGNPEPAQFLVMFVMSVAVMGLSYTISEAWRDAERRARALAETDSLTGLANRRTFFERLEALEGTGASILMLDLDHFKRLNDEFGHLRGDDVLRATARAITESVPAGAIAGRFGGEEFIVALPGVDVRSAALAGETVRRAIANATPTTVSIGCTVRRPLETIDQTIKRADELLYVAKRNGRDRVAKDAIERFAA